MDRRYQKYLFMKYPILYRGHTKSIRESCMAWGFDVGSGWFPLINHLSWQLSADWLSAQKAYNEIKDRLGENLYPDINPDAKWNKVITEELLDKRFRELSIAEAGVPEAAQVKEKFGTLRFYVHGATDEQYAMIRFAENLSSTICEVCGSMKGRLNNNGWIRCRCKNCREE